MSDTTDFLWNVGVGALPGVGAVVAANGVVNYAFGESSSEQTIAEQTVPSDPQIVSTEIITKEQTPVDSDKFDFASFEQLIDDVNSIFTKTQDQIEQLKTRYGHDPFYDQIRNGFISDITTFYESTYQPNIQYINYLSDDLLLVVTHTQRLLDKLKDFPIDAGQGIFRSFILGKDSQEAKIFYEAITLIDALFDPHLALLNRHKAIPALVDFVALVEEAKTIWYVTHNLKTPNDANKARANATAFIASGAEKIAKVLSELPKKMATQVATQAVIIAKEAEPGFSAIMKWLFSQWWTWAIIGTGVGAKFLISYITSPKRNPPDNVASDSPSYDNQTRDNPPLLLINPPAENYAELWKRAQSLESDLNESDFNQALSLYYAQHERYPDTYDLKRVNGPPGIKIGVDIGQVRDVTYKPAKGRKTPYDYKHEMQSTRLVSDPTGKHLFFVGDTYMDTSSGWLKK